MSPERFGTTGEGRYMAIDTVKEQMMRTVFLVLTRHGSIIGRFTDRSEAEVEVANNPSAAYMIEAQEFGG